MKDLLLSPAPVPGVCISSLTPEVASKTVGGVPARQPMISHHHVTLLRPGSAYCTVLLYCNTVLYYCTVLLYCTTVLLYCNTVQAVATLLATILYSVATTADHLQAGYIVSQYIIADKSYRSGDTVSYCSGFTVFQLIHCIFQVW